MLIKVLQMTHQLLKWVTGIHIFYLQDITSIALITKNYSLAQFRHQITVATTCMVVHATRTTSPEPIFGLLTHTDKQTQTDRHVENNTNGW